jgi:hypothetical protein
VLDKELAQLTEVARKAHNRVERLRKKLVAESERLRARAKRDMSVTRKTGSSATARLSRARVALKARALADGQQQVETVKKQVHSW